VRNEPPPINDREDVTAIDAALTELGVITSRQDPFIRKQMSYGMFDTRGTVSSGLMGG